MGRNDQLFLYELSCNARQGGETKQAERAGSTRTDSMRTTRLVLRGMPEEGVGHFGGIEGCVLKNVVLMKVFFLHLSDL